MKNKHETLCIAPWVHLMASPYNEVHTCCMSDSFPLGNLLNSDLKEIWNSQKMRELRLAMMRGEKHRACTKCHEIESSNGVSLRMKLNEKFADSMGLISDTETDGTLSNFNLKRWDIRFTNLCNLRCRMCNHHSSTQWYQDEVKLNPKYSNPVLIKAGKTDTDVLDQLLQHIDVVEEIYFAGGEPLIMEETYIILDELVKRKRFDVRLHYATNLTKLRLKDKSVTDYWSKFKNVVVAASIDDTGARAEYIRKETDWLQVENNFREILDKCPHVRLVVQPTLTILNAYSLPDMHKELVDKKLILPFQLSINILRDPAYLRCDIATKSYKEKVILKYKEHIDWLTTLGTRGSVIKEFESAINFISANSNTSLIPLFWKKTKDLDSIRNENVLDVIPELKMLNE